MKVHYLLSTSLLMSSLMSPMAMAEESSFNPQQKTAIEQIVRDYLITNPEILVEASQSLQKKQQAQMQGQAQEAIAKNTSALLNGSLSTIGNPNGTVTLIEFFDYQCIHCKKMDPVIEDLVKQNSNLKVIFKEFPIFGKTSETASKAALAAAMQGKYQPMHLALIKQEGRLSDEIIFKLATDLHLDMKKLKTDMESDSVKKVLEETRTLAEQLHLMGTPALVIVETTDGQLKAGSQPTFIPGAASKEDLEALIKKSKS